MIRNSAHCFKTGFPRGIKKAVLCLGLLVMLLATPHRVADANVMTIDLSQLSVIRDTLQTVNQQLQKLQELTNIQQEVLDAIGEATGIDPNSILFQGLMELACGKFQLPRLRFTFPMPNIRFPDMPDSLCDWFGYGDNYQSNLWGRVFGSLENAIKYSETMYFINTASADFNEALQRNGNNAYCALWDMRKDMLDAINSNQHAECPPEYRDNPPRIEPGKPIPIPVSIQLGVRKSRKQAKESALISGQAYGRYSVNTAGNVGARIKSMSDACNTADDLIGKLSCQNEILLDMHNSYAQMNASLGYMLEIMSTEGIENADIQMSTTGSAPPPTP